MVTEMNLHSRRVTFTRIICDSLPAGGQFTLIVRAGAGEPLFSTGWWLAKQGVWIPLNPGPILLSKVDFVGFDIPQGPGGTAALPQPDSLEVVLATTTSATKYAAGDLFSSAKYVAGAQFLYFDNLKEFDGYGLLFEGQGSRFRLEYRVTDAPRRTRLLSVSALPGSHVSARGTPTETTSPKHMFQQPSLPVTINSVQELAAVAQLSMKFSLRDFGYEFIDNHMLVDSQSAWPALSNPSDFRSQLKTLWAQGFMNLFTPDQEPNSGFHQVGHSRFMPWTDVGSIFAILFARYKQFFLQFTKQLVETGKAGGGSGALFQASPEFLKTAPPTGKYHNATVVAHVALKNRDIAYYAPHWYALDTNMAQIAIPPTRVLQFDYDFDWINWIVLGTLAGVAIDTANAGGGSDVQLPKASNPVSGHPTAEGMCMGSPGIGWNLIFLILGRNHKVISVLSDFLKDAVTAGPTPWSKATSSKLRANKMVLEVQGASVLFPKDASSSKFGLDYSKNPASWTLELVIDTNDDGSYKTSYQTSGVMEYLQDPKNADKNMPLKNAVFDAPGMPQSGVKLTYPGAFLMARNTAGAAKISAAGKSRSGHLCGIVLAAEDMTPQSQLLSKSFKITWLVLGEIVTFQATYNDLAAVFAGVVEVD